MTLIETILADMIRAALERAHRAVEAVAPDFPGYVFSVRPADDAGCGDDDHVHRWGDCGADLDADIDGLWVIIAAYPPGGGREEITVCTVDDTLPMMVAQLTATLRSPAAAVTETTK